MESSHSSGGGGRGQGSGGVGASTCSVPPVPRSRSPGRGWSRGSRRAAAPPCPEGHLKGHPGQGRGCSYRGYAGSYWSVRLGWCRSIPLPCPRDALGRSRRLKALAAAVLPWHDGLFSAWVAFGADLPLLTPHYPGKGILWCL